MAAKLIAFDEEARSKLLTGVLKLSKAVKAWEKRLVVVRVC